MIGRLLRSADFERVLVTPSRARSAHFAVHYLADVPGRSAPVRNAGSGVGSAELSTGVTPETLPAVDDSTPDGVWLGLVVPKRHARRAVTRTLLKRQIRAAVAQAAEREPRLAGGLWVVRLRAPFDKTRFVSAASDALRSASATELAGLLADARRRLSRPLSA